MHRKQPNPSHPHHHSPSEHFQMAGLATFFLHPLRVALNRASFHTSPQATIKDAYGYMFKGAGLNIIRGGLSSGLQSYVSHGAQRYVDHPTATKFAGLLSATFVGTIIATGVEVPFMRKTAVSHSPTLFKCNRPIVTYFFFREVGFSGAVLLSKEFSPLAHYSILLSAAWLTASCHKLAVIEATKGLTNNQFTTPDYSKGMRQAIKDIGNNVYTLPSLRGPIANPTTFLHRTTNILYATCGPNMFLFRLAYLKAFAELLTAFKNHLNHQNAAPEHTSLSKKMV